MKNNLHLFYGGFLSNFFACKIQYSNLTFTSSEQLYMYLKCMYFDSKGEHRFAILLAETPLEAKKLGRKVPNFNDEEWEKVRVKFMFHVIMSKFSQNKFLENKLLEIDKNMKFAEASPYDKIWGIGLSESDSLAYDERNWKGQNLLGEVITSVRDLFMGKKNEFYINRIELGSMPDLLLLNPLF